ncbi:polysaccharide biosynthesis C-terminal domain-containing protein, partial [Paenibacillus sp. IB182496]
LAAARTTEARRAAGAQTELALRLAWWLGAGAAAGLVLLAAPLNTMLYMDNREPVAFAVLGASAAAAALVAVTTALLQGLGAVRLPVLLLLGAALLKAGLNAALVPELGPSGAAVAALVAYGAAAIAATAAVCRAARIRLASRRYVAAPVSGLAAMSAVLLLGLYALGPWAASSPSPRAPHTVLALGGTVLGGAVYAAVLLRAGGIGAHELEALPGGKPLRRWLERGRLLPGTETRRIES